MAPGRRSDDADASAVFYTTHQVAKLLQVSVPTVVNWVESQRLKAHRTPGGHRRIAQAEIVAFAETHGFPLPRAFWRRDTNTARIVIVDDDAHFADTVREYLQAKGPFEITMAATPFEAGFQIGRQRPDIVLCDPRVARLDGVEVARWLRDHEVTRGIVLVACTSSDTPDVERVAEAFDEVLEKPIRLQSLLDVVSRQLKDD